MRDFKIGDVVRTTKGEDCHGCKVFPVGTIGKIISIDTDCGNDLPYKVEADGDYWWYSADTLEFVNSASNTDEIEIRKITLEEAERISKMVKGVTCCSTCPFEKNGCNAIRCLKDSQAILEDFNERYDDLAKVLKMLNEMLDKGEKEYLTTVLKPYKRLEKDTVVIKRKRLSNPKKEYLIIKAINEDGDYDLDLMFPDFKKGTKYTRLEVNREYTLKELGITL